MIKTLLITAFILGMIPTEQNEKLKPGKYKGRFTADGRHALIIKLHLKKNNTFYKKNIITSIASSEVRGKWEIRNDTLVLSPLSIYNNRNKRKTNCYEAIYSDTTPCHEKYYFINKEKLYFFKDDDGTYRNEISSVK